jgi:GTP-binding protein Era
VVGAKGESLKRIASSARVELEALFDGKVYLEVWVKVRGGWADNAAGLASLGYDG